MRPHLLPTLLLLGGCAMSADLGQAPGPGLDTEAAHAPGLLVVDLVDGTTLPEARRLTGLELTWVSPLSADESLATVTVPDLAQALADLQGVPGIEAAEPSIPMAAFGFPNDPMYAKQWNFEKIGAEAGWRAGGGRGVTVAVIDTGVSPVADLAGTTLLKGASFVPGAPTAADDNGHGTHVAGTIAQTTNNGLGVAGLAPNARILPLKALSGGGMGQSEWIASAIDEAVDQGADVINMSLGGSRSRVIEVAVAKAIDRGVLVVAAAGNGGREGVSWPAAAPGVLAVSATGPDDSLAPYSSWGKEVGISAPGGDKRKAGGGILQDTVDGQAGHDFKELQGTSMAAPHVAGAAAVLMGAGAGGPADVIGLLEGSAVDLGAAGKDPKFGAGRLDLGAAVRALILVRNGLLFFLGLGVAVIFSSVGKAPRRGRLILASGLAAGGLFFLPLLPLPPSAVLDLAARPLLHWPQLMGRMWVGFPLWLSGLLPMALTFVLGPTRSFGPVVAGISLGMGTHLAFGAMTGTLSPWFLPGTLGSTWLGANALLCLFCAFAIVGVQKARDRSAARDA